MSNSHLFLKSGFINVPLQNGIGRYVCQLQRIVFKFCKSHGDSKGMREFIEHDMIKFAEENPGVVVYVKPRRHRSPVLVAEYLDGSRKWMSLHNMSREEIARWTSTLVGSLNPESIRYRKLWKTDYPSIQGPWTPFTSLPTEPRKQEPSEAYVKLLDYAKAQGLNINIDLENLTKNPEKA